MRCHLPMRTSKPCKPFDARRMALHILDQLEASGLTLDQVLETHFTAEALDSSRDRALATAIIYGVLRWRARLDYLITRFSKTPLAKIEPRIRNILRIGLFQIVFLDRVPMSAAVNTAVEMSKDHGPQFIARFVNGVLRNAARQHQTVVFPAVKSDPVQALAVVHSFPSWLTARWLKRFGIEETIRLCEAVNTIPLLTIRVNPMRASREELEVTLAARTAGITPTPFSPDGLLLQGPVAAIPDLPGFQEGCFQVQDEAAQLVTHLLAPRPGENNLDACAGLGGKTAHMAQQMQDQGTILAVDQSADRLKCLATEMQRLGINMVRTLAQDLCRELPMPVDRPFDRILLDAPCSGLGVLRRNPDAKWSALKKDLQRFQQRQLLLLQNLAPLVKPKGVMVYAVCSNEPEENEAVIQAFLSNHPEFSLEPPAEEFPAAARSLIDSAGFLKTYPHRHHTDGFFAARLCKKR